AVKIMRGMEYAGFIIALTANAVIGREEMFLQNGFDGFISKPIDSRELNHCLNEYIRNKKPPEIIEEARREQHEKKQDYNDIAPDIEKFFIHDAENAVKILENLSDKTGNMNSEEKEAYITTVHGIKSALFNIGETGLSEIASKLETASREGNRESDKEIMLSETPVLVNALKALIIKFSPDEDSVYISEEALTREDTDYLKEKLLIIKTACGQLNKKEAKSALSELQRKAWTKNINSALEDIATLLLHSEFDKAAETAQKAASAL
ncbi:MAG: hypothetical protein FWB73_06040, partial [Treponema sp.]|nr:hypothetical protein [Treponema sp.]